MKENNKEIVPVRVEQTLSDEELSKTPEKKKKNFKKHLLSLFDANELVKDLPDIQYLWDCIPLEPGIVFLYGPSKVGKTIFSEFLLIMSLLGLKLLDKKVKQVDKVMIVSLEEVFKLRTKRIIKTIKSVCPEGYPIKEVLRSLFVVDNKFPLFLHQKDNYKELYDLISESGCKVVVIDSATRAVAGKIEESSVAISAIGKLRKLALKLGITLIIIHHSTKNTTEGLTMHQMAGSRVLLQESDVLIGLNKIKNRRYFKVIAARYTSDDSDKVKEFSIDSNCNIVYEGDVYESEIIKGKDGRTNTDNRNKVLEYINTKGTVQIQELKDMFTKEPNKHFSDTILHRILKKLQTLNKIKRIARGTYISIDPNNVSTFGIMDTNLNEEE